MIPLKTTGATVNGGSGGKSPIFCSASGCGWEAEFTTDFNRAGADSVAALSTGIGSIRAGSAGNLSGSSAIGLTTGIARGGWEAFPDDPSVSLAIVPAAPAGGSGVLGAVSRRGAAVTTGPEARAEDGAPLPRDSSG